MKKRTFIILSALMLTISIVACNKSDDGETTTTPTPSKPAKPNWVDSLSRKWAVKSATYDGNPDPGSKGFTYEFKKDGTYDFDNGRFLGTWHFTDSTFKVFILDENSTSIGKSIWTTKEFTSKSLKVNYVSPITGGKVYWEMEPK